MTVINPLNALSMSRAECRQAYLRADGKPYDKVIIGALIVKPNAEVKPEVLMLKRAAHESIYPNIFEIPGGKVEDSDATILEAVKREVFEEAGMKVIQVVGAVRSFDYALEKKMVDEAGGEGLVRYTSLQLNFVCQVAEHNLTVNPEEHSEGRFVSLSGMKNVKMTEQMRQVVEEGLVWTDGYFAGLAASKHWVL
ncbi:MAG: hypothetical protein L6R40_007819 [Gallowayella cf. fulva]|nr:MAG: hypothetical protein L6R40_007819 [Xanthomendoza cf. fulva]